MDLLDLARRGRPRLDPHELGIEPREAGAVHHRTKALRPLRVAQAGLVVAIALMGHEQDGHLVTTLTAGGPATTRIALAVAYAWHI